jgi:hypothetical protein
MRKRRSLWRWMKASENYQKMGKIPFRPRSGYSAFWVILYLICWCVKWVDANWIIWIIRINAKNGNYKGAKSVMGRVHPQARVCCNNGDFFHLNSGEFSLPHIGLNF